MAYEDPALRQPKGDHNRRLSLGLDPIQFAVEAGISVADLREYEQTAPDHSFDVIVAGRVGETLNRLEAILPNSQTGRQAGLAGVSPDDIGRRPTYLDEHIILVEPGLPAATPMTQRGADGHPHETLEMEVRARDAEQETSRAQPSPNILRTPD